ncbi:MAG: hypothetical protein LUC50_05650 [Ruminococcus sp.]|nr:hypothetical protein [Ruminococcus sp.]
MRKSIYTCPHCGEKSFRPWSKALAGGLRTKGKPCKICGCRCVNGLPSMVFSAIVYLIVMVLVLCMYFQVLLPQASILDEWVLTLGLLVCAWIVTRLFDAFFGPLVPVIRNDADSR